VRLRLLAAVCGLLGVLAGDGTALAQQSANCAQLDNTLRSLTRNSDFRTLEQNSQQLRKLADDLRDLESVFVRGGCQRVLNAGQDLPQQCRAVARRIVQGRNQYETINRSMETGQAVARQREVVLQDIARFGCGTGSSATVNRREPTLLEQLFGGGGSAGFDYGDESIRNEDYYYFGMETVRTVCVRLCDGYYWPVSFSTVTDYLGDDAALCRQQSNGADVQLYYYRNPGEDAEQMISVGGQQYTDLPNAFRYRREYVPECAPVRDLGLGTINIEEFGGQSRAVINFGENTFPLPMRDPRRRAASAPEIVQAEVIVVPLPRPRPNPDGFAPVVTEITTASVRQVQFGDKTVRIVGPDTPYVQATGAGT
jgi:Protein of unknown function (DUF2865)